MNDVYPAESEMGGSRQQLCIIRMNLAKAVLGRCRQMQSIRSTQKDRCRQLGINERRALENSLGQRQPPKRSAMRFIKELLASNLVQTRPDGALPKLPVKG